jgi:hypothetical protein
MSVEHDSDVLWETLSIEPGEEIALVNSVEKT